ncbi:MAG TPA: hypothetical protein VNK91_10415 [Burkholderiaceae bacterium]|nr:hypothetical protein [Burkholderiaceae bacterium]
MPTDLIDKARVLDNFYVATRYRNGHPAGAPFEHYGPIQSELAIRYAGEIIDFARTQMAGPRRGLGGRPRTRGALGARARGAAVGRLLRFVRARRLGRGQRVDLVVVVESAARPFAERALDFDLSELPVPADLLV